MSESPIAGTPRLTPMHGVLLAVVAAGIVLARWMLLAAFGGEAPFWDQWDSEVLMLYKPFADGTLALAQFVAPHNEHRILFSRVFNLLLFVGNDGQFDNMVETHANALLYAASWLLAAWPVLARLSGANLLLCACGLLLAGVAPYGEENLLTGFQNAFYFMNAFAVGALMTLAFGRGTLAIAVSLMLAAASLFTLASGLLLAPAIAFVAVLRWRRGSLSNAATLSTIVAAAAIALGGIALLPATPQHQALHPRDVADFLQAAINIASWPLPGHPLAMLVVWWPSAVTLLQLLRTPAHDEPDRRIDGYLLGVAAWVFLQALAIAHARGHEMTQIYSRYTDTLALAPLANLALAIRLLHGSRGVRWRAMLLGATATAIVGGFVVMSAKWAPYLLAASHNTASSEANLAAYLAGAGSAAFAGKPGVEISYPSAERLAMLLDDRTIREMLPASIRRPAWSLSTGCNGFATSDAWPTPPPVAYAFGSYRAGAEGSAVGVCGTGRIRSRFPFFIFHIAGQPGRNGVSLVLRHEDGEEDPILPASMPGRDWTAVVVPNPGGTVSWTATDESPDAWLAVTRPIEIGRLSVWRRSLDAWLLPDPRP